MICYTLYAHGGGGGRELQTRNEFACGGNGGSASNSMYIFRVSIHLGDFPFSLSCKAFVIFLLLLFYMYVCMYCTPVTNALSVLGKQP